MQKSAIVILLLTTFLSGCNQPESNAEQQLQLADNSVLSAELSNDASLALLGSASQGAVLWDLPRQTPRFRWHTGKDDEPVTVTRFSPASGWAVTASATTFALWQTRDGKSAGYYSLPESRLRDIAVVDNGHQVVIAREDGKSEWIDLQSGRRLQFLGHSEAVNSVDLSPNGRYALSGGNDYAAYLWDTQSGQVLHRFNHGSRVALVRLDSAGRYAFTASAMGQAVIWDLVSGKQVSQLQMKHRQEIYSTARFVNQGKWLLTGSPSRQAELWQVSDGALLAHWQVAIREQHRPAGAVVYGVALRDNNRVVTLSSSGYAETWSIK